MTIQILGIDAGGTMTDTILIDGKLAWQMLKKKIIGKASLIPA